MKNWLWPWLWVTDHPWLEGIMFNLEPQIAQQGLFEKCLENCCTSSVPSYVVLWYVWRVRTVHAVPITGATVSAACNRSDSRLSLVFTLSTLSSGPALSGHCMVQLSFKGDSQFSLSELEPQGHHSSPVRAHRRDSHRVTAAMHCGTVTVALCFYSSPSIWQMWVTSFIES